MADLNDIRRYLRDAEDALARAKRECDCDADRHIRAAIDAVDRAMYAAR